MSRRLSGTVKTLLCYLLCWGLAALLPLWAMQTLYPVKLAGTAPDLRAGLAPLLPLLPRAWTSPEPLWRAFVLLAQGAAWLLSLLVQLVWRACYCKPAQIARATAQARRAYRGAMLLLLAGNAAIGLCVWVLGARFVSGFGLWDALVDFGGLPLNLLAAFICFRLAAPPAISGRYAFFKRL